MMSTKEVVEKRRQRKRRLMKSLSKSSSLLVAVVAAAVASGADAGQLQQQQQKQLRGGHHSSTTTRHRRRRTQQVSSSYITNHPYYPVHTTLSCASNDTPPSWMTWSGGYAENHLFATLEECCEKWFPDNMDCYLQEESGSVSVVVVQEEEGGEQQDVVELSAEVVNYHTRPVVVDSTTTMTTMETVTTSQEEEEEVIAMTTSLERPVTATTTTATTTTEAPAREDTFPTSSCGTSLSAAQQCTQLCLPGSSTSTCGENQQCYPNILCPASQVAHAMGVNADTTVLHHIALPSYLDETTDTTNVCGIDYNDAESKCTQVIDEVTGDIVEYVRSSDFIDCTETNVCPNDMICYGGILCPLMTERPTGRPSTVRPTVGTRPTVTTTTTDSIVAMADTTTTTTTDKKDKAEVVGMAIVPMPPPPPPSPSEATSPTATTTTSQGGSPYSIDKSTLGAISVASDSCIGGCPSNSQCVGNSAGGQLITDSDCSPCATGQTWWPCDVEGLCWCWKDGTDRIAPAPSSGLQIESSIYETYGEYYTPCDDILSHELFDIIAPNAQYPYTYTGLCDAMLTYNAQHTEKAFGMGDVYIRAAELAAFLGNTLHESDEFKASREYLMCGDSKIMSDGEVYCKPCDSGSYDWTTHTCGHSLASSTGFGEYCQPTSKPPEACSCGTVKGVDSEGYVPAKEMFFGRGAIQLSWNYNYRGASTALTGSPDTFCENPDLVATVEKYAWGAGLYFWMEHNKEGTTSHIECVKEYNFGGTLNNINGGLECPSHGGWHEEAVKLRLNRYCRAAKALGLPNLLGLNGCAGLEEKFQHCVADGSCSDCHDFFDKNPGEHAYSYSPPAFSPSTNTVVEQEPAATEETPEESSCPEGLIPWEKNSSCCVPNPNFIGDGACDPDAPYNTAECDYDGGDCCRGTCDEESIFGCTTKEKSQFGEYGPFGFYCVDPTQDDFIDPSRCSDVIRDKIGDGMCNPEYNTAECNYDGGDCCEESCKIQSYFECGSGGFVCNDPVFKAAETARPTGKPTAALTNLPPTTAPSVPPTKLPTPLPTKAVTAPPSKTPTNAPTNVPTKEPTKAPITSGCQKDMLECDGGTFVSRNPENNCQFFSCPETVNVESSSLLANGSPTPRPTEANTKCQEGWLECSGGQFVFRNPDDNCNFFPCPEPEQSKPTNRPTEKIGNTMAGTVHDKFSTSSGCNAELFKCPDGHYVGRDAENGCEYFPCESGDNPSPSDSKTGCQKDWLECSGGEFVFRNPGDNCNFFPCPEPQQSEEILTMTSSCDAEMFLCPDGGYVGKDPINGCKYFPCKNAETISSAAMTHQQYISSEQNLLRTHDKKRKNSS